MRASLTIIPGIAGAVFVALCGAAPAARAATLDTLHRFCKQSGCPDGSGPVAALVMADKRHFFGTASRGGTHASGDDGGVVFELTHNKDGTWTYSTIYSFCAQANCADGDQPLGDLIVDDHANLYGTTWFGGKFNGGSVFELSESGGAWHETVIYDFCSVIANSKCIDGQEPAAGLAYAGQSTGAHWDEFSPLFGTTANGGNYGNGTVFKLISDGSLWNQSVIHNFKLSKFPAGGILVDSAGNLFGASGDGGANGGGLFYKLAHDTWNETTLYQFCAQSNCADGGNMESRPVLDASNNLYGTTLNGGSFGGGVVFELVHGSSGYSYKKLKNLCSPSCSETGTSGVGLAIDTGGDLYGTANGGGAHASGAVFKLHHGAHGWKETLLYSFCKQSGCSDGSGPWQGAAPILDPSENVFGTTFKGGEQSNEGTVFELTP